MQTLREHQTEEIRELLLGRRIVAAEKGRFEVGRSQVPTGRLTLDDGTVVYVAPNQGGCSCSSGDYFLEHLATVDNVITDVRLAFEEVVGEWTDAYRIYVFADNQEINVMSAEGSDGDGYYGTGYELFVVRP